MRRRKGCPYVGPLKSRYESVVLNAAAMSELLANVFSAVFVEGAPPIVGVLDKVYVIPENVAQVCLV